MPILLRVVLAFLVVVAAIYDLKYRRIPNWLSLSGLVLGFGCNTLLLSAVGQNAAGLGFLCAVAIYLPLYIVRGMGAGDVKLMAAVGAIAGPERWFEIFLATALVGGTVALAFIARKRRVRQTFGNVGSIVSDLLQFRAPARSNARLDMRHGEALRLPHGVAIASGSLLFLLFHASH